MTTKQQIVLLGFRRNGTTVAFNLFRTFKGLTCFYEPFHPGLVQSSRWPWKGKIVQNSEGVFSEYQPLGSDLHEYYAPFGGPLFPVSQELEAHAWSDQHNRYLEYLFAQSQQVLIQPVRCNLHIDRIHRVAPEAKFIWVLRSMEGFVSSVLLRNKHMFSSNLKFISSYDLLRRNREHMQINPFQFIEKQGEKILDKAWMTLGKYDACLPDGWSQVEAANHIIHHNSSFEKFKDRPAYIQLMLLWCYYVAETQKKLETIPKEQVAVIRYEDLCLSAEPMMSSLGSWLQLDSDQNVYCREIIHSQPASIYEENNPCWDESKKEILEVVTKKYETFSLNVRSRISEAAIV